MPDRPPELRTSTIYHIADRERWNQAMSGAYEPASFSDEGFIHASAWHQLGRVATNLFAGREHLLVLEIDVTRLPSGLAWEDLYNSGETFPHVYGPIQGAAVTRTMEIHWNSAGLPVFRDTSVQADLTATEIKWEAAAGDRDTLTSIVQMYSHLHEDENHPVIRTVDEYQKRMAGYLESGCRAFVLRCGGALAGYALVSESDDHVQLRHFFIRRGFRRMGLGTRAFGELRESLGCPRVRINCLIHNRRGMRFWHGLGFKDRVARMELTAPRLPASLPSRDDQVDTNLSIEVLVDRASEAAEYLKEQIQAFNDRVSPLHRAARNEGLVQPVAAMLSDASGRFRGGASGKVFWDWLSVDDLWVEAGLRGHGYGSALLARIEKVAQQRGARRAELSTFGFQARGFYEKHGYRVVGELADYPPGSSLCWLSKTL